MGRNISVYVQAHFFDWPLFFSTHSCCLNPNFLSRRNQVRNKYTGKVYIVAESRLSTLHNPKDKPKEAVANSSVSVPKNAKTKGTSSGKTENVLDFFDVLEKFSGASLVGMK
jgi:isoleucyl-tRNA synthetase